MNVKYPPQRIPKSLTTVFLAGSIEMGEATEWQKEVIGLFNTFLPENLKKDFTILNPRRPDWDSNWKQEYEDPHFYQQVKWELKGLEQSDWVVFYFDPATKSPISLLELGRFGKDAIVVCPEGFWKKGNIDIFCEHYGITQFDNLGAAVDHVIECMQ